MKYRVRTPKKLKNLIEVHADLAGDIANYMHPHPQGYCIAALMKALKVVTENTRCEAEALALIETCEQYLNDGTK
ncbi:hypothetical protein [Paenibacillus oryzisoli]|uniref:Uncharacterized protein n=1 Tax=Paenibacillus oryzisoli TaxID=1850517 RepID=A0A198ADW3_9BACL|nr:hypothetical protein [Paenibacillus oryzisoli]OAS19275.1 hypothetical protein A8708_26560 [Paenibacillus oryzisoli]